MADLPSGDGTAESAHMADLALDLADQLISAFQQEADRVGGGEEGEATHDDGTRPSDSGTVDLEAEAKDGNDEWQELAEEEEDRLSEGFNTGVKGEGVGQENPGSWVSPVGSHSQDFMADPVTTETHNGADNVDVVFSPARVLTFDDSDGDDLPAVDQQFIPRGVFVQSDFLDDRPELHGSEEADYFAGPTRASMAPGDHSQNVRIIEGHDDLDLDRGARYMSLAMRNNFLQTQVVQLPPLTAEDHNLSANLYDSLEREDEDSYLEVEEQDQEGSEDDVGYSGRDYVNGEDGSDPRDAHGVYPDRHFLPEDPQAAGQAYEGQYPPRAMQRADHQHGNGDVYEEDASAAGQLPARNAQSMSGHPLSPQSREQEQQVSPKHDGQKCEGHQAHQPAKDEALSRGSTVIVTLPKSSNSGANLAQGPGAGPELPRAPNPEQLSARPKQPMNKSQPRGGPAGSNGGEAGNAGGKPHPRANLSRANPRAGAAGANGRGRSRAGVGSARQVGSGAQTQRPAVQGAAVGGVGGGGDGDGAVAGNAGQGLGPGSVGPMLSSRTSSQGSIHSNASNNSNSRVGGVGKESNSNHYNQPQAAKAYQARPGNQYSAAAAARGVPPRGHQPPPPPQQRQQQHALQLPPHAGMQPPDRPAQQPPPIKPAAAGGRQRGDIRAVQLQQQHEQLRQEQQHLQQKQRHLQQQQQQQQQGGMLGGMESPDGDHLVHHQPEAVLTQVGRMQQESHQQEKSGGVSGTAEVQGMEEVRSVLQSMLRLPKESASFDPRGFDFSESATDLLMDRPSHYQHDGDSSSLSGLRAHGQEEMSEMFEGFPSFSYKLFPDMSNLSTASERSVHSDNAYLRECLEKERYRRKHCEQQIQNLNAKLLEVQQQLAVAVSTDKRKDIMIDQLDRQLAKVVEGWKKREAEKDEYMAMLMKEKSQIEETLQKQQTMIDSFEKELASTVEELKREKENSAELVEKMKAELSSAVHDQRHAEEMLAAEKERATLVEREWEQLKESRDLAEKRAQQAQDRLHEEQDNWYQREQELLHKIDQVKEANLKVMQMERVKLEEQTKKIEDLEEALHGAQTEVKRLEMEVDSAVREKESLKVEMALTEAKFESAQRSLEADLQAQMEKKISEEVSYVQDKMRQELEGQEEKHRQMVSELHQRHQRDLEMQIANLRHDLSRKEADLKQQLAELENRLRESQQENSALKQAKQKLESQRLEVLGKLQFIMQSQWNEAVSLLVSTPQRKTLNTSLSSSMNSSMLGGTGLATHLGALATSSAPQFNLSSSAQPAAASASATSVASSRASSHQDQHRSSGESPSFNNLSGLQSPRSSPRSPPPPQTSCASSMLDNNSSSGIRQGGSVVASSSPPFPGESGISLQDISSLLSGGHYLPPGFSASMHGVTHSGGLVVQTRHGGEHHPTHHPHQGPQGTMRHSSSSTPPSSSSEAQAVLIRPPQQLSRPASSSHDDLGLVSASDLSRNNLSLLSQRDLHWSEQLSQRDGRGGEREVGRGGDGQRQKNCGSDRGLELSDLDVGLQAGLLMVNGEVVVGGRGPEVMGTSVAAYSPSMSPPVKQGRDGEQDSTDGSIQHESERLNSSYREISRHLEQHQSRQRELQHYIKMTTLPLQLLEKPPQGVGEQPERDSMLDPDAMDISFTSVAVDLGLTDAAQAAQMSTELQRLQQLRERQQPADQMSQPVRPKGGGKKKVAPGSTTHSQPSRSGVAAATSHHSHTAGLPAHQLAEISRLLGQYSEDVEASSSAFQLSSLQSDPSSMAQILSFLASLPPPQQHVGEGGQKSSSTKSSPSQQQARRTRDPQRSKRHNDVRHHSAGPDTSTCSSGSVLSDKHDKTMASSSRSTGSSARRGEKKSANGMSASTSASTAKQNIRPLNREQNPVWKSSTQKSIFSKPRRT